MKLDELQEEAEQEALRDAQEMLREMSYFCECSDEFDEEEEASNRCKACGKALA